MTSTPTLTVRPVRPDEHAAAGALSLAAFDAVAPMTPEYRAEVARIGARLGPGTEVLVAVAGDELLGCVTFADADSAFFENPGAGDCGFRMLAVDPTSGRRGAGTALVLACVSRGEALGRRRLAINSMTTMTSAHALYERLGFVRRPDRDVRFPSGPGMAFERDLVADAAEHFPPPGPVPQELPWYADLWKQESALVRRGC